MRRVPGGLLAIVLTATVAACSLGGPKPDPAADKVADAFTRRDVSSIKFSGTDAKTAQADLSSIIVGMKDVPVKVTAGGIQAEGDKATGTLTWTWQVAGRSWVSKSPMSLVKSKDTWRVVWNRKLVHPDLQVGEKFDATTLLPRRGDILGAGDHRIVTLRPVDRYGIDKRNIPNRQAVSSARLLAAALDIDAEAFASRVGSAGANAFVEGLTLRRGTGEEPDESEVLHISGARILPALIPLAPTRDFAAPILGTVGQPTAEMIKKSKDTLKVGDQVGLSGLQARYDDQLKGTPGLRIDVVDAKDEGHPVFRTEPVSGKPLRTTLDLQAQELAEKALDATTLAHNRSARALVAIRPSTGDILAAASGPKSNGYNTATYGRYAPGSTFKVVSSLALLRSGVTPDSMVDCPPTLTVDGKRFKNYSDYPSSALGRIPFRTAITNSCNTAVIGQLSRLGKSTLTDAAAALGLGVDHDLGFPSYFGSAPVATSETEGAADMIGQGKVLASPMTMATIAASVRRGSVVVPRLLPDLRTDAAQTDPAQPAEPLTAKEADQLRRLMRGVVTEGSGGLLLGLPGDPVLAKTGTAEYGDPTTPGAALKTHAWMIAIHGDLAVAVFVEDGASGSGTAGPILEEFLLGMQ